MAVQDCQVTLPCVHRDVHPRLHRVFYLAWHAELSIVVEAPGPHMTGFIYSISSPMPASNVHHRCVSGNTPGPFEAFDRAGLQQHLLHSKNTRI